MEVGVGFQNLLNDRLTGDTHVTPPPAKMFRSIDHKSIPNGSRSKFDFDGYKNKPLENWSTENVIGWVKSVSERHKISFKEINVLALLMPGKLLQFMNKYYFLDSDPVYGAFLYDKLKRYVGHNNHPTKRERHKKLLQFVLRALDDPNYEHIRWVNRLDGSFKIEDVVIVASQWGMLKRNGDMTADKFLRALRTYHYCGILATNKKSTNISDKHAFRFALDVETLINKYVKNKSSS